MTEKHFPILSKFEYQDDVTGMMCTVIGKEGYYEARIHAGWYAGVGTTTLEAVEQAIKALEKEIEMLKQHLERRAA